MSPKELHRALSAILPTIQQETSAGRVEAIGVIMVDRNGKVSQFLAATSVRGADALSAAGLVMRDAAASMVSDPDKAN